MKLFEISKDFIEEAPFNLELNSDIIIEVHDCIGGIQIKLDNINLITGMNTSSFLLYIIGNDLVNNILVGTAYLILSNNNIIDTIEYQVRFSEKEFEIIKNFT